MLACGQCCLPLCALFVYKKSKVDVQKNTAHKTGLLCFLYFFSVSYAGVSVWG